jgi:hypothetical protein
MKTPASQIGPHAIQRELGRGGMGVVYLATDTRLDRQVAIKALPEHLASDADRLARFQREAKLLATLNHPNVGAIYGLEEVDGSRYLILEYVEGETLADRLQQGPLPIDEAIAVAVQIAAALEAAHEKGVVHRDLKPGNIMIAPDGRVKVLDFGLARQTKSAASAINADSQSPTLVSPAAVHSPTITGEIMGTAGYMSPEQARGKPVDKRSDIFSFGCVLYEMLGGRRAFEGETVSDLLATLLTREPQWDELPKRVGPTLRSVLSRCLEKNRSSRYRDIGDVAYDLVRAPDADAVTASGAPKAVPARVYRVVAAVGVLATLVAITLAMVLWGAFRTAPSPPQFQKLTFSVQFITSGRFTSDGRTVVFSAARDRMTSELFVLRPEDLQPRKLGASNVQLLAVSATGELAVLTGAEYLSHRTYIGTLARMPLTDAPPREVLDHVTAADWSPDGSEFAVIRRIADRSRLEYPIGTVLAESTGYLSDVRISPNGELVAFMEHDLDHDNRGPVVIVNRKGAEVARSSHYRGEEGLAWAADAKSVFFSAQSERGRAPTSPGGGEYIIWALSLDGTVRKVLTGAVDLIIHDVHPSGKVLGSTETNLSYLVSRLAGETAERDVLSLEYSYPAAISADGRSLLFTDESLVAGPNYAVRFQATPDSPAVHLGEGKALDLSPDGKSVLAMVLVVPPRLMIYAIGAGAPQDISPAGFVSYRRAFFYPDGKSLLLSGTEMGKGPRCYRLELPDGAVRAVTPEGTDEGRLSPDGLAVVARRRGVGWFEFPINGGEEKPLRGLKAGDEVIGWSRDGRSLFVLADRNVSPRIERYEVFTGKRKVVQELTAGGSAVTSVWNVVLSADELSYAYTFDRSVSVLYAVEGVR